MLSSIIEKLTRTSAPDTTTNQAAEMCRLPHPDDVRRRLAAVELQLAADDAEWERLDRTSNPHAFTTQQQIAVQRAPLEAQRDGLRRRLVAVEKAHHAFGALVQVVHAMDEEIAQTAHRFYRDIMLIASKEERRARLELLDGLLRARARIVAPLAVVSPARSFRRAPDPLAALTQDLRARADEIDRTLGPGMPRAVIAWPAGARELIDALKGGTA